MAAQDSPVIVWFRNDLRLTDNPALAAAIETGRPVICLYVYETAMDGPRPRGGASLWWLHNSLEQLSEGLNTRGGALTLRRGDPREILRELTETSGAASVFWNRRYDAKGRAVDAEIKSELKDAGVEATSFNGSLLTEPWTIQTGGGGPYKVFTPYWRAIQKTYAAPSAAPAPETIKGAPTDTDALADWGLLPARPNWASEFSDMWTPGEAGAQARLEAFLGGPVDHYQDHRNRPDVDTSTSGLSPHLHFGEIGPAQIWRAVKARIEAGTIVHDSAMVFLSEVVWREFSYVQLYHNPDLASVNYNPGFDAMPWRDDGSDYARWCKGETGYPIVDAGMRQLWRTGWMHNRVRMIVASFLTKHLLIHWTRGEDWFWDTLVDADPASNAASWQWTAGSGADAAPYFRVFNPITQGQKFDETGDYVRRWVPELAKMPTKSIHAPWEAPTGVLRDAGVTLGETYPLPMIDHKEGRQRALDAYDILKSKRDAA